jgi:hypothetical protein
VGDRLCLHDLSFVCVIALEYFKGTHRVAVCLNLLIVATHILHHLVNHELRVLLMSRHLMPVTMAIRRPQRRASYSAILLDAGKCRRTAYLMCPPRGEMKRRPAPASVFITDQSK